MNPYVILGVLVAWGASLLGTGWVAFGLGQDNEIAGQAKITQAIADTREAAQQGAAAAIAKNKPINTTIVQKTQKEIRENTIYADCRVPAGGMQLANQALTGRPAEPAGGEQLPAAGTAKR